MVMMVAARCKPAAGQAVRLSGPIDKPVLEKALAINGLKASTAWPIDSSGAEALFDQLGVNLGALLDLGADRASREPEALRKLTRHQTRDGHY